MQGLRVPGHPRKWLCPTDLSQLNISRVKRYCTYESIGKGGGRRLPLAGIGIRSVWQKLKSQSQASVAKDTLDAPSTVRYWDSFCLAKTSNTLIPNDPEVRLSQFCTNKTRVGRYAGHP